METLILVKQDLKNLITNPTIMVFCLVYPIFLILLFGFLFSNLYTGPLVSSYDFYGITMTFYLVLECATITPMVLMEERVKKANLRIAYSPVSRTKIYLSKLLSTLIFLTVIFTLNISILNCLNIVNYGGSNFIYVLILLIALLMFSITLGAAVCVSLRNQDLTNKILGAIINTLAIFSGVFFPISTLGTFADNLSNISPVKMVLNMLFQIIYDNSLQNYGITILIILVFVAIFMFIINRNYRPEDYI